MWIAQSPARRKVTPKPYLLYYGSLLSINNYTLESDAVAFYSNYDILILKDPSTQTDISIVSQLAALGKKIFLYTYLGVNGGSFPLLSDATIKSKMDYFKSLGCHVFLDQYGFDFQTYRTQQIMAVNYAHSIGINVVANAWNPSDAFGKYPDSSSDTIYNPTGIDPVVLGAGDYFLLESFGVTYNGYRLAGGSSPTSDRTGYYGEINRIDRVLAYADKWGFTPLPISYYRTNDQTNLGTYTDAQGDTDYIYKLSSMCNFPYYCMTQAALGGTGHSKVFLPFAPSTSAKVMDAATYLGPLVLGRSDRAVMNRSVGGVDYQFSTGSIVSLSY